MTTQTYYVIFTTDTAYSNASKTVIGVCSSMTMVFKQLHKHFELDKADIHNLKEYKQTDNKETNIIIEEFTLNEIAN